MSRYDDVVVLAGQQTCIQRLLFELRLRRALNDGGKTKMIPVANSSSRTARSSSTSVARRVTSRSPIPVTADRAGSHYHFFETNPALKFDRKKARSGRYAVETVVLRTRQWTRDAATRGAGGKRVIYGFRGEVRGGAVDPLRRNVSVIIRPRDTAQGYATQFRST